MNAKRRSRGIRRRRHRTDGRITPEELDKRLGDIAKTAGVLTKLRNEEANEERIETMTAHLCSCAVRLFERAFNLEKGQLAGMMRTLSDGPSEARAMAAIGLVERFLRAIADESYSDSVFAGLGGEPSMSMIRQPVVHGLRFSEQLLHECSDTAHGKEEDVY